MCVSCSFRARLTICAVTTQRAIGEVMIAEANRDIRCAVRVAEKAQRERLTRNRPFEYLDDVIVGLETLHLKGLTNVPRSFMARLQAVGQLLPPEIDPPSQWRPRFSPAIDHSFHFHGPILQLPSRDGRWSVP